MSALCTVFLSAKVGYDMSSAMQVYLTDQIPSPIWGPNARISFENQSVLIHLNSAHHSRIEQIQRGARQLVNQGICAFVLCGPWDIEDAFAFHQGAFTAKETVSINLAQAQQQKALAQLLHPVLWVRHLINQPASELTPLHLAKQAASFLQKQAPDAVKINMIVGQQLHQQGYMGLHIVGKGSRAEPVLLEVDYNPSQSEQTPVRLCLVGKGITFDSGGYSLKPNDAMITMKSDMGGAATVTGALALAISRGLAVRVKLFLCCAENMVSGEAFRLGDMITYANGVQVEVLNTDAEGRLVLADGFLAAGRTQAPVLIDAATLTGAAKMALGREYHAILTRDPELSIKVAKLALAENEYAWPLPLAHWHSEQLSSDFADLANVSTAPGCAGASTAAAFLARFLPDQVKDWIHLDLSASYQPSANALWSAGAKGHGVRTIARLIQEFT